ncbi:hypothetical protein JTE90_026332 [Oedothorax gibbosus]|uniref:Uncharacterized protein n=1 Tax=Oedothorax gibbosus TaxID=931172 RepID=A0AAV6U548_9ARAC|nr:hypothetical protein JTE90_026332 [Oedothorax gibbosus]
MGLDRRMQCFIDQLLPNIWSRYLIPEELTFLPEPSGLKFKEISPELIELLSKAIWVQSKIAFHHWVYYLRRYYEEMVSSPRKFVTYVTYACNTMGYNIQDHYERFVTVCSLLVGFGANFYYSGNGEVLRYIPQILAVFFERVLMAQFYDRGGWRRLDKYLLRQEYLNWHDEIQIECPNETPQQRVTRELNFARKVEAAIAASASKDYDMDGINEQEVECDFVTVKVTDEIMRYFSEASPSQTSATSQPIDEAAVEIHKDVAKGMMEIVKRARLDAMLKSQQLIAEGGMPPSGAGASLPFSGTPSNVIPETEAMKQPDSIKPEEPVSKRLKTKKRKVPKTKDAVPDIPQFIQKANEASVASGGDVSSIINRTEIRVLQKPDPQDCTGKPSKTKKQKTSKIKDNNLHSSPLSVEKIKEIMYSEVATSNESVKAHKDNEVNNDFISYESSQAARDNLKSAEVDNETKCMGIDEVGKLGAAKGFSDITLQEYSDNVKEYEFPSSQAVLERNRLNILDVPDTNGTFPTHQITQNVLNVLQSGQEASSVIRELIADENTSEIIIDEGISAFRSSKNAAFNSKPKENNASDPQPSIKRKAENETFGFEDIGDIPANGVLSPNASYLKYKTKREAMNEIIRIVDNLAPKIEMFVVMLDSLVWDLKKDS